MSSPTLRAFTAIVLYLCPLHLTAASRELYLPGIGSAFGMGGRRYETSVWIVNPGDKRTTIHMAFVPSEATASTPREIVLMVGPGETAVLDPLDLHAFGLGDGSGVLKLTASSPIAAVGRVWSRLPGDGESRAVGSIIEGQSRAAAIGNDEEATLPGIVIDDAYRYKLHVVETAGEALDVSIAVVDAGGVKRAARHLYVGGNQPRNVDLQPLVSSIRTRDALVRIRGFHGNGRVIATLDQIAADGLDFDTYAIVRVGRSRLRLPAAEVSAYVAMSLLVIAGVYRASKRNRVAPA